MILNANIPLNTPQPTRQHPWRVGLFLSLALLGGIVGWGSAKRLFVGITTPLLEAPSGISIRITPENALWLTTHTKGLALTPSCPIDLPTLISYKGPTWIILGDTGENSIVTFKGNLPNELQNYQTAFACTLTNLEKTSSFFPLTTPDGWAWKNDTRTIITLSPQGISIALPGINTENSLWVPKQTLIAALPLQGANFEDFPRVWQGLNDFFTSTQGVAFFAWKGKNEETALALTAEGDINDEIIRSLFYDIANIPTSTEKQFREDNISYFTTKKEEIFLIWKNETEGEVLLRDEAVVGYITKQGGFTLLSTEPTEWTMSKPNWKAQLRNDSASITHQTRTLAYFGIQIFATKKKITITDEML